MTVAPRALAASLRLALLLLASSHAAWLHADEPRQPNLVYLLADNLGYGDLGSYGQELIRTTRLDQFAAEEPALVAEFARLLETSRTDSPEFPLERRRQEKAGKAP
jgi:hypothetical protein